MPQLESSAKRLKQSKKRATHNKTIKDGLDYLFHQFKKALEDKDKSKAKEWSLKLTKAIDKAAQKKILKKNTAARKKSKTMKKLNSLK